MNYIEWIRTVGLAVNLLVKTEFNDSVSVQSEWRQQLPSDLFTGDSISALFMDFRSRYDSTGLTGIYIIPWDNLYSPNIRPGEITIPKYALLTVAGYSVIYQEFESNLLSESNKKLLEKIISRLKELFDYYENQKVLSESDGITLPEQIQLISQKEYKYYIEQSVALPGSKSILKFNYDSLPENKMILRHLVPDFGQVKSQWIFPVRITSNKCSDSTDSLIRAAFSNLIESLLKSESADLNNACSKSDLIIDNILAEQNCHDEAITNYYKNLIRKLLLCSDHQIITELPYDNIFGDYRPKDTPDVLSDYMPGVYEKIHELPQAELQNLPALLLSYKKLRREASRHRGKWVEGNVILGANPEEYQPSESEIMLYEVGNRIKEIKENNSVQDIKEQIGSHSGLPKKIRFRKFDVIHIDVMGSGRFFYISNIEELKFRLY